jgi:hypothetical protein
VAKRITFMLEEDVDKKLRETKVKRIQDTNNTVSFSEVINETLRKGMKK